MNLAGRDLLRPVDGAWLARFRILYGLALAVSMERFIAYGWIETLLVAPRVRFHYWGFGWVEPLPAPALHALFWGLVALAFALAAGFAFRITSVVFALGLSYVQLIDVSTYLNHYYLAALLAWLLAFSPAQRRWSIDAWLFGGGRETVPIAWLYVFRVQVGVVYFFAGLAKLQGDWLLHGQPLGIWLGARTHLPILGRLFVLDGVPLAMSWFGFFFDISIVAWLSWRKTRPWAYAVVVGFHVLTRLLFDIGMFPIIMSIAALVFFEPRPRSASRAPVPATRWQRCALGAGALYCLVQVLVPLRSFAYGGNVLWHEQGMRLSWRVMVRAKGGAVTFVVRQTQTGREFQVSPREYLTAFQENEMASQPDLVLQLAHHIGRDYDARGLGPVEVRAESAVSLNGRRGAPLVDPKVDLLAVHDGVGSAHWIMPAPTEPPPHTRPVR